MNDATFEITIFGDSPEEMKNARIIDEFKTPSSESYLVDVGAFDDGMRMYVMLSALNRPAGNGAIASQRWTRCNLRIIWKGVRNFRMIMIGRIIMTIVSESFRFQKS